MEIVLQNICFFSLLINTISYWLVIGVSLLKKYTFILPAFNRLCLILLSFLIILRWYFSGHFPLSNLYESLIFLAWTIQFFLIKFENKNNKIIGLILSPTILFIDIFANFALPTTMQSVSTLVPSLQSNWLLMHVTIIIVSYGALFVGCIFAISYLAITFFQESSINFNLLEKSNKLLDLLDDLSYRTISIGFPLLTLGILSGAIWANETWGSYWNWDPKETWALITWLIFAIYLHTRLIQNWNPKESAKIASFGFVILWICYLGVNLLGKGLHSYGWWFK